MAGAPRDSHGLPWLALCDFRQELTTPIEAGFKISVPFGITGNLLLPGKLGQESLLKLESQMQMQQMTKAPLKVWETNS